MPNETTTAPMESEPTLREIPSGEVPVYITKSNYYRVIHADGMYGGGTPTPGNIMMTVFSHRLPFPQKTVSDANGSEISSKREVKYGVEQEYEVSIVMNLDTARRMLLWLNNSIKNTEKLLQQTQQKNQ